MDNPQTNAYGGLGAMANVDTYQVNFGGVFLYRTNGMDTEVNGDASRSKYKGTTYSDYSIGYFSHGSWANYTRHYPAGSYYVYARLAAGGGATTCALYQVTSGWGSTIQGTNLLGTFSVANTAWETYNYVPLRNASGNLAVVTFSGPTNTLRLARPGLATSDCNANFLTLIPVFTLSATCTGSQINISFPTQSGFNYQLQYKSSLADTTWNPLATIAGDSTVKSISDSTGAGTCFYRVQIQ